MANPTPNFGDVFGEIGKASVTTRSDYVKEGDYLLEVAEIVLFKGNNGPTHKARLIVREALKKGPDEPSAVGSSIGVVNVLAGPTAKVAPGKIKGFTLALFNLKDGDVPAEKVSALVQDSCDEKNPCKGMLVRGSTSHFTSKGGVQGITLNFLPVDPTENAKAKIAARAAAQK